MKDLISQLENSNPELFKIIKTSRDPDDARNKIFSYLNSLERKYGQEAPLHNLEIINAKKCISVFKNLIFPANEKKAGFSTLHYLIDFIQQNGGNECFLTELIHLFRGISGKSGFYIQEKPPFLNLSGREAASIRSDLLDNLNVIQKVKRYPTGLAFSIIEKRKARKDKILKFFKAKEDDWNDWEWHVKNVVRTEEIFSQLLNLPEESRKAVKIAEENRIPFGITPYYLSLMDDEPGMDDAVRAQVVPPLSYMEFMAEHKDDRDQTCDFMKEHDTSPVYLVTRRYPSIAILKPFNTCPQICVYCQRNWEIEEVLAEDALASREEINKAIQWFKEHPAINEILITGGDPGILQDEILDYILRELCKIEHLERIRIATRILVTIPMRVTEKWTNMLAKYHEVGKREIYVVTHVAHPYEITPEMEAAVQKLRRKGFSVYNQQVFTPYNTKRFETAALRRALKLVGIDPYYSFFPKGKREARNYLLPVARVLQERKEEARLLPGSIRTDEPVFNVPGLGKNHLRAWQDHEVIGIDSDGSRIYEFHPWEKNITPVDTYIFRDIPITEYLKKLEERGEDAKDYDTIWWYY